MQLGFSRRPRVGYAYTIRYGLIEISGRMVVELNPWRVQKAGVTLIEAAKTLDKVIQQVAGGKSAGECSHAIWEVYSKIEYSILMLKLHLGVESPGRFAGKVEAPEGDMERLVKASGELSAAVQSSEGGDYHKALESARRARDILRSTLLEIRKVKARI